MKIKLLRDQRIMHKSGEIVEVSPDAYKWLIDTKSGEPVAPTPKKKKG